MIVALVLVLFALFNLLTIRQLLRIHPNRKPWIINGALLGNAMWLFLPILNAQTDFSRFARATLGPPWFAWIVFAMFYSLFMLAVLLLRIPPRAASRAFLIAISIGSIIGCWQALVPLHVERLEVGIANLPPELEGKKLAVLGDLHVGLYTRPSRLTRIFSTVNAL
ncbi:MAG TPA: hypothetical protein VN605_09205 [Thermoanaerobaculia bacterium]|nr:hypothetical protein [Thermoanaerobaculia bacterium]